MMTNMFDMKPLGKVIYRNGEFELAWSASGLSFLADLHGNVYAELVFEHDGNNQYTDKYTKMAIFLDNAEEPYRILRIEEGVPKKYLLLSGERGIRCIRMVKINEKVRGTIRVRSIEIDGEIIHNPENKKERIEFLGDSLTAGSDLVTHGKNDEEFTEAQDCTKSYAYVAAQRLQADISILARSGLRTSDRDWLLNQPKYWMDEQPDIVVIGLGTNDQSQLEKGLRTPAEQEELVRLMLERVREKYSCATIVWAYGLMLTALEDTYDHLISRPVKKFAEKDGNTYFCMLPKENGGNGSHSSPKGHKIAGEVLAEKIMEIKRK